MANKQRGESMVDLKLVASVSKENRLDQYIGLLKSRRQASIPLNKQAEEREGAEGKKEDDVEEVHQKKTEKRAPAKKAAAPDTPDVGQKFDTTSEVKEAVVEEEAIRKKPAKKGAKGKNAEAITEESDENMGQHGGTVTADKMRSPEKMQGPKSPKAAKSNGRDIVEGKKRGRKPAAASTGEENVAETVAAPAARRGPLKKAASALSGVESKPEEDEEKEKDVAVNPRRAALKKTSPVPQPEGDEGKQEADAKGGRGKRKKANEEAQGATSEQPELGATAAVKPERDRGAKANGPAARPSYLEMAVKAVKALKEHKGSSREKILKYVMDNFNVGNDAKLINIRLKVALKRGVAKGQLKNEAETAGAPGCFRLGDKKTAAAANAVVASTSAPTAASSMPAKAKASGRAKVVKKPAAAPKKTTKAAVKPKAASPKQASPKKPKAAGRPKAAATKKAALAKGKKAAPSTASAASS